jgi:beta-galactosidase
MSLLSRRDLLRNTIVAGATAATASVFTRHAWARAESVLAAQQEGAVSLHREKLLFDFDWKFLFGHATDPAKDLGFGNGQDDFSKTGEFAFAKVPFDDSKWRTLNLPHDWAVELPFVRDEVQNSHGYKPVGRRYPESSIGWYRRIFEIPASDQGRRITLDFDGVFRDLLVWVNGCFIGRNDNGYAPFSFDITDFLSYGAKNCIVVRVDASFGDGWFYEGAGIYRHLWLTKTNAVHLGQFESYIRPTVSGQTATLALGTTVQNHSAQAANARVTWSILDPAGKTVATAQAPPQSISADGSATYISTTKITNPALWSVEAPALYTAVVTVESAGQAIDSEPVSFGIRSFAFDPDNGFSLNGTSMKIKGTCNHQDHAGVGAALPDRLQYFRLAVLKEMGSNAVRTSHNMPTPEWVEGCDRMGLLMMCETRQMSSNPEGLAQLAAMVKRYRNSPSIILWSIGNEENQLEWQMAAQGERIATTMVRLCHELDPTRPVSAAVNAPNEQGLSNALDVIGFNYNLAYPDNFHKKHPRLAVYGSETASALCTRGVYSTDPLRNTMSSYDTNEPGWGETAEDWWKFYATRDWTCGGFAWTGFDYRGEPTPYGWPSISSQFGIVDTCGFPKDTFYYYRAWWGKEPVLHLFPHWNWEGREGESIKIWVHSNCDEVELFVNGVSQGSKKVPHLGHLEWSAKYQPGSIEARGKKDGKVILTEKRVTTGAPVAIRLIPDPVQPRTEIDADGEDIAILRVEAVDKEGRLVPTAHNFIGFKVSGAGTLIGVGNGDPNCQESDKEPHRSLFNGLAQIIVQSTREPGEIHIEAVKEGWDGPELTPAKLAIITKQSNARPRVE